MLSAMPKYSQIPLLTADDYRALPGTGPRYQLIEGDLYMAPAPNRFHQDISRNLQFELQSYLKANPVGKLYGAPFDVYLDEHNVFQPDLIVVLNEHAGVLGILSENDQRSKIPVYAAARIKEVWIVDLIGNCIHTYRRPGTSSRAYVEFFSFDRATRVSPHTFPDIRICCLC
jgi:Uma2 family endonuclease